jgi:hypothetical protein
MLAEHRREVPRINRFGRIVFVTCLLLGVGVATGRGQESGKQTVPAEVVSRMDAVWKVQQTGVVTARIEFDLYRYFDDSAKALGRDGVAKVIESLATAKQLNFANVRQIAAARGGTTGFWPARIAITSDKSTVKNVWGSGDVIVWNGKEEIRRQVDSRTQTDIYAGRTNFELFTYYKLALFWDATALESARVVSPPPVAGRATARFDGTVQLSGKSVPIANELDFDAATGFIFAVRRYDPGVSPGPKSESVGLLPVQYDGGIMLPTIKIDIDYSGERVRMMSIHHIKKVVLNDTIDPITASPPTVPRFLPFTPRRITSSNTLMLSTRPPRARNRQIMA